MRAGLAVRAGAPAPRDLHPVDLCVLREHQRAGTAGASRVSDAPVGKGRERGAATTRALAQRVRRDDLSVLEALGERLLAARALGARPLVQVRELTVNSSHVKTSIYCANVLGIRVDAAEDRRVQKEAARLFWRVAAPPVHAAVKEKGAAVRVDDSRRPHRRHELRSGGRRSAGRAASGFLLGLGLGSGECFRLKCGR